MSKAFTELALPWWEDGVTGNTTEFFFSALDEGVTGNEGTGKGRLSVDFLVGDNNENSLLDLVGDLVVEREGEGGATGNLEGDEEDDALGETAAKSLVNDVVFGAAGSSGKSAKGMVGTGSASGCSCEQQKLANV